MNKDDINEKLAWVEREGAKSLIKGLLTIRGGCNGSYIRGDKDCSNCVFEMYADCGKEQLREWLALLEAKK
jgi:hypothetical protein